MSQGKARILFEQGMTHFHNKDYEKAVTFFEESILESPENVEALYNLSCSYAQLGDKDNALVYIDRACRLNPECSDWAKEDREFDGMRNNSIFKNIISSHDLVLPKEQVEEEEESVEPQAAEPSDEEFEEFVPEEITFKKTPSEPLPNLNDGRHAVLAPVIESDLPPCLRCDGVVIAEKRSLINPLVGLGVVFLGICFSTTLFLTFWGLLGIPIISGGLYIFTRVNIVWVCQNCGAKGADCGQPKSAPPPDAEKI
ncbi:MAG: tetratricopeptide repeat protein [Candidatus Omnitrophota bacterium]